MLLSLHPDYVMTHRLVPLAADRTLIECAWAFAPEALERPGFDPAYAVDFWDLTNRQDWAACESVQRGLTSPLASPGRWHRTRTRCTPSSPRSRGATSASASPSCSSPPRPLTLQASAAGPRRVIWPAMIMRWISLVPSQIRSTRSSRKNRSATFSRM